MTKGFGLLLLLYCLCGVSCKKYLDAKPDQSLAVPASFQDFQGILDNNTRIDLFPMAADIASDDYFLKVADLSNFGKPSQLTYVWDAQATNDLDWSYNYSNIESFNIVLDGLKNTGAVTDATWQQLQGSALFLKGYTFFQLANVFSMPYDPQNSATLPGIPLRLSSDITAKTTRSTMAATYQQMISDLKSAAALLPVTPQVKTRPSKPAAYGALARVYLAMQDYSHANVYADSCLSLYNKLIDYNTLNKNAPNPIGLFNDEVIFHGVSHGGDGLLYPGYARVDTNLYVSYSANDLRKGIFYTAAGDGYFAFKGDYSGQSEGQLFNGIAVDEVLLIRAETYARLNNITKAMADLNLLLSKRYAASAFIPYPANTPNALAVILAERRKELAFRSAIRWSDLRRLNSDPQFAKTLYRHLGGTTFMLPPGDKRYAFLIPASVIQLTGIQQNAR